MKKKTGILRAIVEFPIYEGDKTDGSFDWFVYEEPGINIVGGLATTRRPCTVVSASFIEDRPVEPKKSSDELRALLEQKIAWMDALDLLIGGLHQQTEWVSVRTQMLSAMSEIDVIIQRWHKEGD